MEAHEEECSDECNSAEKLLDEYVLNDVGKIWMGSYGSARGREWVYGQYDDAALPVCVYLLERCGLSHSERADPVLVSRALTKMVLTEYICVNLDSFIRFGCASTTSSS